MYPNKDRSKQLDILKAPFKRPTMNLPVAFSTPREGGAGSFDRTEFDKHCQNHSSSQGNHYSNNHQPSSSSSNHNHQRNSSNHYNNTNYNTYQSDYNRNQPSSSGVHFGGRGMLPPLEDDDDFGSSNSKVSWEEKGKNTASSTSASVPSARDRASVRVQQDMGRPLKGLDQEALDQGALDASEERARKERVEKKENQEELARVKLKAKSAPPVKKSEPLYTVPKPIPKNSNAKRDDAFDPVEDKSGRSDWKKKNKAKGKGKGKQRESSPPIEVEEPESDDAVVLPISKKKQKKQPRPPKSPTPLPVTSPKTALDNLIKKQQKLEGKENKEQRKKESLARRAVRLEEDGELASDSESEVYSDSDMEGGEESYNSSRTDKKREEREESHDELLMSDEEAPDPSTLCPFCSRSLPVSPSKRLKSLQSFLLNQPHIREKPTARNPLGMHLPVIETASFCRRHVEEKTVIPDGISRGWPETIDGVKLQKRIDHELFDYLSQIITGKIESQFFLDAKQEWADQGSRKMNNILSEFGSFDVEQPGYYGTQGQEIMITTLRKLFIEHITLLTPLLASPLDISAYLRRVLVPECAVELIRIDLGPETTREEAEIVCRESRGYGLAMFGASEEEERFGREEFKREQKETAEKELAKDREKEVEKEKKAKKDERKRMEEEVEGRKKEIEAEQQAALGNSSGAAKRVPKQKLAAMEVAAKAAEKLTSKKKKNIKPTNSTKSKSNGGSLLTSTTSSSPGSKRDGWKTRIGGIASDDDDSSDDEVEIHSPKKKLKKEVDKLGMKKKENRGDDIIID